ncbi:MAG TPA: GNAT family N-acetyltransferase [Spirochaetota bacterium]|nr:GNAT family N-acetyltransferase [Spirochaetota bacterium]HRZ28916.1 GNAT family N-acetyltransferase [Spirochaetota bacterium]HSA16610.1 GNAT family N-acetyltransferase [Spirochaetota bacterium]
MRIIDLDEHNRPTYFHCLEDWSDEMKESGPHKSVWYEKMKTRGLRVKLAVDDDGSLAGMIQYLPVEESFVVGRNLYFIYCIWVHGHKQGIGNRQKKGLGTVLLNAAEKDARSLGAAGMAAWGLMLPVWMKASWFRKHGYRKADRDGIAALMWKPFSDGANPPAWMKRNIKPVLTGGRVTVTSFVNGWCPAQNIVHERARRASQEFGERVVFHAINTLDRGNLEKWGVADGLFIDGREVMTGPPPSYAKIRKMIGKRVRKLK